jgi:hypothetical protein
MIDPTDDFTPMEQELVAQARLITNAKYEMREQDFCQQLSTEAISEEFRRWARANGAA